MPFRAALSIFKIGPRICILGILISVEIHAQNRYSEETTSAVFQDSFFEALKHQSLQNYDRAIEKLKLCDSIDPNVPAVAFQLGKNYAMIGQNSLAQASYLKALQLNPKNKWFLEGYYAISVKMSNTNEALENLKKKSETDKHFSRALSLWYAHEGNYTLAYEMSKKLKDKSLNKDIELIKQKDRTEITKSSEMDSDRSPESSPNLKKLSLEVKALIEEKKHEQLEKISKEALEIFPSQALFYYAYGLALSRLQKFQEALEPLLSALDFWVDDTNLQRDIYIALAECYKNFGNAEKSDFYLQKL